MCPRFKFDIHFGLGILYCFKKRSRSLHPHVYLHIQRQQQFFTGPCELPGQPATRGYCWKPIKDLRVIFLARLDRVESIQIWITNVKPTLARSQDLGSVIRAFHQHLGNGLSWDEALAPSHSFLVSCCRGNPLLCSSGTAPCASVAWPTAYVYNITYINFKF